MLALIKFFFVFFVIFAYFLLTAPFFIFLKIFPYGTKKILNHLVVICSKILIFILGIRISHNLKNIDKSKNYFIVSNHLSYTDILIISSIIPTSFVTSVEMKKTPFLGQIIQLAGCLFVERRNKKNILNEIGDIENALNKGLNVTVFPEATSTNGEQVLNFKRSLFQSAMNTQVDVLPMTLNYRKVNGENVSSENRDSICWYGDMEFAPHLWSLCKNKSINVDIITPGILSSQNEKSCTAELRDNAFEKVVMNFQAINA